MNFQKTADRQVTRAITHTHIDIQAKTSVSKLKWKSKLPRFFKKKERKKRQQNSEGTRTKMVKFSLNTSDKRLLEWNFNNLPNDLQLTRKSAFSMIT